MPAKSESFQIITKWGESAKCPTLEDAWTDAQKRGIVPSKSKAQSKAIYAKFGPDWVKKHHFDNPTKGLPQHVSKKAKKK